MYKSYGRIMFLSTEFLLWRRTAGKNIVSLGRGGKKVVLTTNRRAQLATIVGMVAQGLGLSLLVPQMMGDGEGNTGCRFLPFVAPVPTRQVNIVRNPLRFQSKAAMAFSATAFSCFAQS
jgi:DNA-binding transcriptional LysR family regulator